MNRENSGLPVLGVLPELVRGVVSAVGQAPSGRNQHGDDRGVVLVDGATGAEMLLREGRKQRLPSQGRHKSGAPMKDHAVAFRGPVALPALRARGSGGRADGIEDREC